MRGHPQHKLLESDYSFSIQKHAEIIISIIFVTVCKECVLRRGNRVLVYLEARMGCFELAEIDESLSPRSILVPIRDVPAAAQTECTEGRRQLLEPRICYLAIPHNADRKKCGQKEGRVSVGCYCGL